jgi:hypothetical protein
MADISADERMIRVGWRSTRWGEAALAVSLCLMVGCPGDSPGGNGNGVCGNGVREAPEECDGDDLGGMTCADLVENTTGGELLCNGLCEYETYSCSVCGDGHQTSDEGCDCGTDPAQLPAHCLAENGAPWANCSVYCERRPHCGDGVITPDEECDCGTSSHTQNPGCAGPNGAEGVSCDEQCLFIPPCMDLGLLCEPDDFLCCDDVDGQPVTCAEFTPYNICVRSCADDPDCYWSSHCLGHEGGICMYLACALIPGDPTDAFTVCQYPAEGWCVPIWERFRRDEWFFLVCAESGTLAPGASCPNVGLEGVLRTEPMCEFGVCVAEPEAPTGICRQFCGWEAAYEASVDFGWDPFPCPAGTNCFTTSGIDPATGIRTSDLAYCMPTRQTDPVDGLTTCSLVTDQLLSDPWQSCAGLPTPSRCDLATVPTGAGDGSLVGVCVPSAPATLAPWDECTANDVCPSGTACAREDAFSASPNVSFRCVPYCDTATHDAASCQSMGAAAGAICVSLSKQYGGPADVSPTRLGYCVLP